MEESGDKWNFNEGCLSIPSIREDISRLSKVRIRYQDQDFNTIEKNMMELKLELYNTNTIISKVCFLQII